MCENYENYENIDLFEYINFFEYDVENPEFLEILNGDRPIFDMICWESLRLIMEEMNKKFCAERGICEKCRSEMLEYKDYDPDGKIVEWYWVCKNGC